MSNETKIRLNSSAIVAAVVFLCGTIFSSGIVVQEQRQAIALLKDIQHKQEVQHTEFLQFKEDMNRRVSALERKAHVLDSIDINRLRGYSTPGVPYDPTKPLPSPQPGPACWPCLDKIFIA